jgi:hypothetical protein
MRRVKWLVLACLPIVVYGQTINYARIEILTEQYTPNLYMLAGAPGDADPNHPDGAGGRIGLLTGPDGIFMVDSQYEQVTDKVLAAIRKISSQPIRYWPIRTCTWTTPAATATSCARVPC